MPRFPLTRPFPSFARLPVAFPVAFRDDNRKMQRGGMIMLLTKPLTFDKVPLTLYGCDSGRCSKEMQRLSTAPLGGARTCLSVASPAAQCLELTFLLHRSVQRALFLVLFTLPAERKRTVGVIEKNNRIKAFPQENNTDEIPARWPE